MRGRQFNSFCCYSRDPRAPLYSCAACGVRPIATPLSPHRRIALDDLVRVFEFESVLAASAVSTKAAAAALFTKKQMERIATGRRHVDSSGITADKMPDYFESQDRPADGGPVTHRCFHLHRQFVDEHVGCPHADPRSATSSTDIPDAPCASCTAVARARLELGADALSAQLAAVTIDCPETSAPVYNPARAALRSELVRLLAQLASYDEQIRVASTRLDADGLGEEARALCSEEIAFLRAARVTPVLVSVTTRRKMHTLRRAVDEHVACPCSGVMSDSDEAPLSPHAPCALCADDEARGCVPVPGRSALLCAACADANDRWTTFTESIAAGFQHDSLRPFGMRVLTPLKEQTIAISHAHMLVLKLYAGSGEQPVLRGHVFSTPQEAVPAAVLRKTAEAFRVDVKAAARLAVIDDPSCTSVAAKMTALITDDNAVSLPRVDLLGRISVFAVGPADQLTLYCSRAAPSRCCPALQQRCCSPRWRSWRTG